MHHDLIALARKIARSDPRRPKQANLRKAVSTAYYALFHFLIDQSCRCVIGTQHIQAPYRHVIARAFAHSDMKSACKCFASGGSLKKGAAEGLPTTFKTPAEIKQIAGTFVEFQEKRHMADYDLTKRFSRSDAVAAVSEIEIAIKRFAALRNSDERKFFLACLWAWKNLANK